MVLAVTRVSDLGTDRLPSPLKSNHRIHPKWRGRYTAITAAARKHQMNTMSAHPPELCTLAASGFARTRAEFCYLHTLRKLGAMVGSAAWAAGMAAAATGADAAAADNAVARDCTEDVSFVAVAAEASTQLHRKKLVG